MITGFPELHTVPLIVALLIAGFGYFIVCLFCYRVKREKLQIRQRVEKLNNREKLPVHTKKEKHKTRQLLRLIGGLPLSERLGEELALAGIMLKPEEFVSIWAAFIAVPALLGWIITQKPVAALGLALIGGLLPVLYIKRKHDKRMRMFENQLGDSLTVMSNCLRSGLSLQQAMLSISREMPEPISKEFGRVLREVRFGSTIEDALTGLTQRVKNKDLELMVSAILIQRQVGGNLSEILDNISSTILSRVKIRNDIRVMTATGRVSGIIIGALPLAVGLILMVLNPEYFSVFLTTDLGAGLLVLCVIMEATGFFCISRIIKIEY